MWDWLRGLAVDIMPFGVIWLVFRTEQLGRQIQACRHVPTRNSAKRSEREEELRAEWKEGRGPYYSVLREKERKDWKDIWELSKAYGMISAVLLAIGFLVSAVPVIWAFLSARF
jgi:hypothetical protein